MYGSLKWNTSYGFVSKINTHTVPKQIRRCAENDPFLRGAGTLPTGMPLALGSVKFMVTHGLCCFMGLSISQKLFLWGNTKKNHFLLHGVSVTEHEASGGSVGFVRLTLTSRKQFSDLLSPLGRWCGCFFSYVLSECFMFFVVTALCWTELLVLVDIKVRNKINYNASNKERRDKKTNCK